MELVQINNPAASLAKRGFCMVEGESLPREADFASFAAEWNTLPPDVYLDCRYGRRARRYARLRATRQSSGLVLDRLPHGPFTQAKALIPLHEGRARAFPEPTSALLGASLNAIIRFDLDVISHCDQSLTSAFVGVHFIRVWASSGKQTLPAPEGRHRDGHDFVAMHLISRRGCTGASSIVYEPTEEVPLFQMELAKRLDTLIVNDCRMEHEVGPLTALEVAGFRDMLIIDYERLTPLDQNDV